MRRPQKRHKVEDPPPGPSGSIERLQAVPAFEVVLRRPNLPDRVCYRNRGDAEIGDVVTITGRPWIVIAKDPPFELRRIERIICVPRLVRHR